MYTASWKEKLYMDRDKCFFFLLVGTSAVNLPVRPSSLFFLINTTGVELVRHLFVAPVNPDPDAGWNHSVASVRSGSKANIASTIVSS